MLIGLENILIRNINMLNKNKIIPKRNIKIPIRNTADKYIPGIKTVSPGGMVNRIFQEATLELAV